VSDAGEVGLDLQDGFSGDEVIVSADGQEIALVRDVTSRTQLSLARSLRLPLGPGAVRLTVAVRGLGLAQSVDLPGTRPLWVGASLTSARDRLEFRVQTHRFVYGYRQCRTGSRASRLFGISACETDRVS